MNLIFNEILRALGYLFIAYIAWVAWKLAKDNAINGNGKTVLWKGLLYCIAIAIFASIMMGNPTCEEGRDPLYGGCERYTDDGYEPTMEQRTANFAYYVTLLYIPVIIGAFNKQDKNQ